MKKEMKDGSQKEMFLLCYIIDLPRVKEKRWWHSGILYGFTNVQSYQVTKEFISRPSHAKVPKMDSASVLNRNIVRWIFAMFYLFISYLTLPNKIQNYKTVYIK